MEGASCRFALNSGELNGLSADMARTAHAYADDVTEGVIKDSGHWLMEEQPDATIKMINAFLSEPISPDCPSAR
ncbi:MAG: alpha/beta hydrolase [Caulobacterales bacterium]